MEEIRICLVGDTNTGKSTFVNYIKNNNFTEYYRPTIGVEYMTYNDIGCVWKIWDTSGNIKHNPIILPYFKLANLFILFFDINNIASFLSLKERIKYINHESNSRNHNIILVGNKSDLLKNINQSDINTFCNEYNIDYIEISIKNFNNIGQINNKINNYLKERELKNQIELKYIHNDYEILLENEINHNRCCKCNIL